MAGTLQRGCWLFVIHGMCRRWLPPDVEGNRRADEPLARPSRVPARPVDRKGRRRKCLSEGDGESEMLLRFDEDHQAFWQHAVIRHCLGSRLGFHG
jgi:hypothetical protein